MHLNPVDMGRSLLALAPVAIHGRGCVAMALSTDGVRFGRLLPLMPCEARGERAVAHPVAGVVLGRAPPPQSAALGGGGAAAAARQVHFFVQPRVPSISVDAFAPNRLYKWLTRREKLQAQRRARWHARGSDVLERYSLPCSYVARWTAEQQARARGGGGGRARAFAPGCDPGVGTFSERT